MPGNETIYRSGRTYLPLLWVDSNLPQNADRLTTIAGAAPNTHFVPIPQRCSVTAIVVLMTESITNGTVTVALCKNAVVSSVNTVILANGPSKIGRLNPGDATYDVGDTIGIHLQTPPGFTPNAQIDTMVYLEVQND